MSENKVRVGRTVRLTPEMNNRLLDLCDHLGTNPNAYLVTEIGKAIARDELSFQVSSQAKGMFDRLQMELSGIGS